MIHSAEWKSDVELKNKVVGVIGSGASAIQVIPSIAKDVKELHSFQRKAPYVEDRTQFYYPAWVQKMFTIFPFIMLLFRFWIYLSAEALILAFKAKSIVNTLGKNAPEYTSQQFE